MFQSLDNLDVSLQVYASINGITMLTVLECGIFSTAY